jgi:hypothetical protein
MWKLYNCLLVFIIVLSVNAYASTDNAIEAKVSKSAVSTGEIFTYTLKIEGQFHSPKIALPEFENFTIASQSQQRQYTSKNGGTNLTLQATYNLFATNAGNFTIKGASLIDEGKRIETQPITIEVTGKPLEEKLKVAPSIENGTDI